MKWKLWNEMKAKISREVLIWVFGVKLKSSKWTKVKMSRGQYDAKYRLNVLISLSHWRKKTFGCMFPSTRQTLDYSCRGGGGHRSRRSYLDGGQQAVQDADPQSEGLGTEPEQPVHLPEPEDDFPVLGRGDVGTLWRSKKKTPVK